MEHRAIRPSDHAYGGHSLPSLHESLRPSSGALHSPNHSIPHHPPPPPPPPTQQPIPSQPHHTAPSGQHPYQSPPVYGAQPTFAPHSRPERPVEGGYAAGDGSGHATPVNVQAPDMQAPPPQPMHTPDPSQPHSSVTMHHPGDRHADGPQSAPPGYPHPSTPFAAPQPFNPQLSMQMAHPDHMPMPHQVVDHPGYPMAPQPHPGYGLGAYVGGGYVPHFPTPSSAAKKKGHRASQACEKCRERKSKCDESRPTCQGCRDQNLECVYRDTAPSKAADKNLPPILNEMHSDVMERFDRIERLLAGRVESRDGPVETSQDEIQRMDTPGPSQPVKTESFNTNGPSRINRSMSMGSQATVPAPTDSQDRSRSQKSSSVAGQVQGFDEHTTAAHKLLHSWPSIFALVNGKFGDDYVLHGEARGLLRLEGRGEAEKTHPIFAFQHGTDFSMLDESAAPPDIWEQYTSPMAEMRKAEASGDHQPLDLRADTVQRLLTRYIAHVHDLHPFVDLPTLEKFLHGFVERHRPAPTSPHVTVNGEPNSKKRKRSEPFPNGIIESSANLSAYPRSTTETSLPAAISFLVLALGAISEWQGQIPGPVPTDDGLNSSMPPPNMLLSGSPSAGSRPSPASSWGAPTPPGFDARSFALSPQQTFESPAPTSARLRSTNVDSIPGLNYYREACRIIGLHNDSNDLPNAQARLLAGLYKGQLGRVQESWSWISDACRICRYQARMNGFDKGTPALYKWRYPLESRQGTIENTLLITCWSALQLESDILAELNYPHSGLAAVQETMPYPRSKRSETLSNGFVQREPMDYYHLQLYLRKRLNEMHSNLYAKALPTEAPSTLALILESNEEALEQFLRVYPWNEQDPPPENILEARLRAKFYGAKYICLRPYLDFVLHALRPLRSGATLEECAKDGQNQLRPNELKIYSAIATMSEDQICDRARRCVQAAINSTEAFDRVPGRLILTNIVGTGHAQFSNMLVLSAAFNSGPDFIRELIPKERLKGLLERTINFIGNMQLCSPTARQDIRILRTIHRYLFGSPNGTEPQDAAASFASEGSTAPTSVAT